MSDLCQSRHRIIGSHFVSSFNNSVHGCDGLWDVRLQDRRFHLEQQHHLCLILKDFDDVGSTLDTLHNAAAAQPVCNSLQMTDDALRQHSVLENEVGEVSASSLKGCLIVLVSEC